MFIQFFGHCSFLPTSIHQQFPTQHKSDTHQKTTSSDPHKVPDICGHMILLNVYHLSVGKEEQDVCHDAASGERDEGESQRPGKAQGTHLHTQRGKETVIRDRELGWWTEEWRDFKRPSPPRPPWTAVPKRRRRQETAWHYTVWQQTLWQTIWPGHCGGHCFPTKLVIL